MKLNQYKEGRELEIRKEQCPDCAAAGRDEEENNLSVYKDGSTHCWNPKCGGGISNYEANGGTESTKNVEPVDPNLIRGEIRAIVARGITKATCEHFNVRTGTYTGTISKQQLTNEPVIIYPIYDDDGLVIKQKIRSLAKKSLQTQVGKTESMRLFGQNKSTPSKKVPVIITEGEYDAMCIYQATGYRAVSGVRGAGGLIKELSANLEWLMQWSFVILAFDNDDAGQAAVQECLTVFEPGMVRSCTFPLKDANEMVLASRSSEIKQCLFDAKVLKPNTLVTINDIREKILVQPEIGSPWPFPTMTKVTYGLRWGEVYLLAAAKGTGKTTFMRELVMQQLENQIHVGLYSLEETPEQSVLRFIGGDMNKQLHLPGSSDWDEAEIIKRMDKYQDYITLCDKSAGKLSLETVLINIRYSNKCYGTKFFIIDNLKKLAACPTIGGKRVSRVEFMCETMTQLSDIAVSLNVTIFVIQHLNSDKPDLKIDLTGNMQSMDELTEGFSWETGMMPGMRHIYGGGEIMDLADHLIVLGRNRTSESMLTKCTTTVKFLQTRLDGTMDGTKFKIYYNLETGRTTEKITMDYKKYDKTKKQTITKSLPGGSIL